MPRCCTRRGEHNDYTQQIYRELKVKINISEIEVKGCWECPLFITQDYGYQFTKTCIADGIKLQHVENEDKKIIDGTTGEVYYGGKWMYPCEIRPCPKELK